ncbi:hypothetical protein N7492_008907 [Penicillium capsulatum]|uniref:Transketolase-like pyrimidine-binding domain-containing protein n=1 Tax=Penicillium capsulatum TaxID=69766 RepID=A0A9W9LH86_9EURO|nr:hypothetical protein N7492_008907 [Penicillium capsulatum]KAJ6106307.1 hypothetical protein N7512_009824 [Penicillium capsulatum]
MGNSKLPEDEINRQGTASEWSNVARKPNELIFSEFSPDSRSRPYTLGDVKYHLGMNYERVIPSGKNIHDSIMSKPSHPYRCLLRGPSQFTTNPESTRTSPYASDITKSINGPIFHVNADNVEAVVFLCKLAADYRAALGKDCWVDMICCRKYDHNEMDQPFFTQPKMYEQIETKVPDLELYTTKLVEEGVITREEVYQMEADVWGKMSASLDTSKSPEGLEREYLTAPPNGMKTPAEVSREVLPQESTAVTRGVFDKVASNLGIPDEPFQVHKSLNRILKRRQQSLVEGQDIDWATAEALAIGRSTYTPLNNLDPEQAEFTIGNSSLSEYGVMGFDYGYSCMYPSALCILDQFISSAENKWLLRSGIVLSLPHGLNGQGLEYSSARMERFLQLCSEDGRFFPSAQQLERQQQDANMQVVSMTTPANLFHELRRQLHRDFWKPLILFFSKSLLRHPAVKSNVEDFTGESQFQPVIPDPTHVYMALAKYREAHGIIDTAITRVEQLHPFPWEQARDNLNPYSNIEDVVWCQEKSLNDGPWAFAKTCLETIFDTTEQHKGRRLRYPGRGATPSVATGFGKVH